MIHVANAPCSWGVLEFGLEGETPGYVRVLDEMSKAGYAGTELGDWGFMPTDPGALKAALAARGLLMVAAFVPVALADASAHAAGVETAVKTAKLLRAVAAAPKIVLADDNGKDPERTRSAGRVRPEQGLDDARWRTFAAGCHAVARAVRDQTGVATVFHHHCAGFVETPAEIDRLLSLTDPALLSLCFDTGHFVYGGGDALEGIRKHAARIGHVHFKDCDPAVASEARAKGWDYFEAVRRGVFCELGKGSVPFGAIVKELEKQRYDGWIVVEQDVLPGMGTPFESAKTSREVLRGLGLAAAAGGAS